jgi:MFS family permease
VGNILSFRVRKRLEPHVLIAVFVLCQAAALWLLVGAGPAVWVAAALLAAGLANGICNPSLHAMTTLMIPPAVRSQALTAVLVINQLAAPVGFLGAGVLLAHWGVRPVFHPRAGRSDADDGDAGARDASRAPARSLHAYGFVSRAQRFSSICATGTVSAEPPKSSVPPAKTLAPFAVS